MALQLPNGQIISEQDPNYAAYAAQNNALVSYDLVAQPSTAAAVITD